MKRRRKRLMVIVPAEAKKGNLSKTIVGTGNLDLAENAFTELLMERFEQDEDAFSIVDQSEIMEAMSGVTNTMSLMIGVLFDLYPANKAASRKPIDALRYSG